ncbi:MULTISPECIES: thioredoxin family protein [unclassified Saccharicrinis]|uniref:thioredoxin family protein n=1 Tax=unclassified Saccharicrinis TaxID=2646859 RepID=UPI003D343A6C
MIDIRSAQGLKEVLSTNDFVLGYFSHDKCTVCKALLPKVEQLIASDFPKVKLAYCNIEHAPRLAAHAGVFTAPTLILYVQEKEYVRYSRNIGLDQLAQSIARPYHMLMEN